MCFHTCELSSCCKNTHYVLIVLCCCCCTLQYTTGVTMNGCKSSYSMGAIIGHVLALVYAYCWRKCIIYGVKSFIVVSSLSATSGGVILLLVSASPLLLLLEEVEHLWLVENIVVFWELSENTVQFFAPCISNGDVSMLLKSSTLELLEILDITVVSCCSCC